MHVLILNRHPWPNRSDADADTLEYAGHTVTSLCELRDEEAYLQNPLLYLSQFNVALAHPSAEDAKALHEELQRRQSFRVIIFNIDGKNEMNGRLRYASPPDGKSLLRLIEN